MANNIGNMTTRRQHAEIEGPTPKQARKLAAFRAQYLADAKAALEAGNDDRAFDLDCRALDMEADLIAYGFNPETGLRNRTAR